MPEQKYSKATEDIKKRFELLPETVKKELTSPKTSELIATLGHNYGLDEEKISAIAQVVGEVLLGYLLPEEMTQELNAFFDIRLDIADKITNELNQKVFSTVKNELEKIYNPLELPEEKTPEIPLIRRLATPPAPPSSAPPPPPARPTISATTPTPAPAVSPKPMGPKVDLESFEIKGPSPFMLHQETVSYPTAQEITKPKMAPHIELTPQQKAATAPPRPINVRLETPAITTEQKNKEIEEQKQLRVVHYSNLRTPLEEKPQMAEQRNRETEKQNQLMEKPALPPLPTRKELTSSREQEKLDTNRTKIVNYAGPNTPLTAAGTPKPEETNTVDLRKMFKAEPKPDEGVVDLRKKQ